MLRTPGVAKKEPSPFAPYPTDWGAFAPLRLRARTVAEGLYAGMHRSVRKGPGVEFGGLRPYVLGDDLRFIDKRALLKHERMMIREFETETDRALWLVVDATASMAFRGRGPGAKYAFAALIAASLARIATSAGDPVGVVILGGDDRGRMVRATSGREAFDRIVYALSTVNATSDWSTDDAELSRALGPVHERARRGSSIVVLSDFIDLPTAAASAIGALGTRGRRVFGVQVLSPDELELPFDEHARFRSLEGAVVVEADPAVVRARYQEALGALRRRWSDDLVARGGGLVSCSTADSPVNVVRSLLLVIAGARAPSERRTGAGPAGAP